MVGAVEETLNLLNLRNKLYVSLDGDSFSLASYLGYGTLSGLLNFKVKPEPKNPEQFKQIEIQSVYESFNELLNKISKEGSGTTLIDLMGNVNQKIECSVKKQKPVYQSVLLNNIISDLSINRRAYENKFRWNGVQLDRAIVDQSTAVRLRDNAIQDYNLVVRAFAPSKIIQYKGGQ